ncbi:unnamed protein product [Cuscuta campestris]|uniref:Uncharacterized protein n=1 Tax=Cuscuta campestris TaxID=132261 RepID=A0A484N309_9ASTE|nr:unnamed protein product [Cuscuta campestris]
MAQKCKPKRQVHFLFQDESKHQMYLSNVVLIHLRIKNVHVVWVYIFGHANIRAVALFAQPIVGFCCPPI